jgi:hypothetical protein
MKCHLKAFRPGFSRKGVEGTPAVAMPFIPEEAAPLSPLVHMMQSRFTMASVLGALAELKFDAGKPSALADQMQSPHRV